MQCVINNSASFLILIQIFFIIIFWAIVNNINSNFELIQSFLIINFFISYLTISMHVWMCACGYAHTYICMRSKILQKDKKIFRLHANFKKH